MSRIRMVGLDLDGTLVSLSETFLEDYLKLLDEFVSPRIGYRGSVSDAILASTAVMCASEDPSRWLQDVFYNDFRERTGLLRKTVEPVFQAFYREAFPRLRHHARPIPGIHGILAIMRGLNLPLALMTNPVFPEAAIQERLAWAGLEDVPFAWKASFETAHTAKPQPAFFGEAARTLGVPAQEWLMVGNDLANDIYPAARVGMQTWWITDGHGGECPQEVHCGSLHQLVRFLRTTLPSVSSEDAH